MKIVLQKAVILRKFLREKFMKKKILIFTLIFLGLNVIAENAHLDLKGKLGGGSTKSFSQPLEVLLTGNDLKVNFFDCLDDLTITVISENGLTVYQQTVNTCVTTSVTIDIQNLPAGRYNIIITDELGGWIEGWFEI